MTALVENEPGGQDASWAASALCQLDMDKSLFELRDVRDLGRMAALSAALRDRGNRIVLTSGSFDILHEGHSMYLEAAREYGDFLVVGVDSDEKIRSRKGPGRPAVPELERLRMVTHQRGVGAVFLKSASHARWALIKAVRPDTLVATEDTYTAEEMAELETEYCGLVKVLPRMATISTSARLRLSQLEFLRGATDQITFTLVARLQRELGEALGPAVHHAVQSAVGGGEGGARQ